MSPSETKQPSNRKVQVELKGVTKEFDGFRAVNDVSLEIYQGEIFALLGASGCGKSTLLRMLAGFESLTSGDILLDGQSMSNIPPYQRPINMMFQSYALFPHMTVEQNIAFGWKHDKLSKPRIKDKVSEVLGLVRMSEYAKRKPHQLSGGQQQRVALARSLAKEPKLLLLDEPMGALDKKLRTQMQLEIVDILESVHVTCVMVTHDQEEAMTMASRVGVMDQGVIRQVGAPFDVYEHPNSRMTAEFIGSVNIFEGKMSKDEADHAELTCPELEVPIRAAHGVVGNIGMDLAFALRPEKITISRKKPDLKFNYAQGVIRDIAYLGSHSIYHVDIGNGKIVLVSMANADRWGSDEEPRLTWEEQVYVSWAETSGVMLNS